MALSEKLADLFVEFGVENDAQLKTVLKEIEKEFREEEKAAKEAAKAQEEHAKKVGAAYREVGAIAVAAFASAQGALMGFVRAGFAGTAESDMFGTQLKMLSQEIASIFLPIMEAATEKVMEITDWFRSLSGEEQDNILQIVTWVGAIGLAIAVIPKIVSAIGAIITVVRSLGAAMAFLKALTGGWAQIALAVAATAAAVVALEYATGAFDGDDKDAKKKKGDRHRHVTPGQASMESVTATYNRIQMAAFKAQSGAPRDYMKEIADNTGKDGVLTKGVEGVEKSVKSIKPNATAS